jgi:hypothetical protein
VAHHEDLTDRCAIDPAERIITMEPLRHLDRDTRRARLLAARTRPVGGINRRGIFTGHWDRGDVVRQFRGGNGSWLGLATYSAAGRET